MYCKYRDSLFNIRYSYRGKKYHDVPVHRCIVAGPAMANTKDHHLHSVCPCCDVVQHIKAIICCHGILTLSNRNAHTGDANTLKTKTTLLFTVFKFTVLCTTLLSSRAIIPVTLQICVQSTVHECTKKNGVSHQINIKLDHFLWTQFLIQDTDLLDYGGC